MVLTSLIILSANDVLTNSDVYSEIYILSIGVLSQFAGGYIFVFVGGLIAPNHYTETAIAFIAILLVLVLVGWFNNGLEVAILNLVAVLGGWLAYEK